MTLIDPATGAAVLTFPPITAEERPRTGAGVIFNGGVVYKIGGLNIAPEFRYTRWNKNRLSTRDRNHVDFLLTLRF